VASDWSTKTVSGRTRPEAWRVVVGQQPMKRLAVVMADSDTVKEVSNQALQPRGLHLASHLACCRSHSSYRT
jgi:hypothetical protein